MGRRVCCEAPHRHYGPVGPGFHPACEGHAISPVPGDGALLTHGHIGEQQRDSPASQKTQAGEGTISGSCDEHRRDNKVVGAIFLFLAKNSVFQVWQKGSWERR